MAKQSGKANRENIWPSTASNKQYETRSHIKWGRSKSYMAIKYLIKHPISRRSHIKYAVARHGSHPDVTDRQPPGLNMIAMWHLQARSQSENVTKEKTNRSDHLPSPYPSALGFRQKDKETTSRVAWHSVFQGRTIRYTSYKSQVTNHAVGSGPRCLLQSHSPGMRDLTLNSRRWEYPRHTCSLRRTMY
jgi:hypothetical protein